jgi:hypothetical protein
MIEPVLKVVALVNETTRFLREESPMKVMFVAVLVVVI